MGRGPGDKDLEPEEAYGGASSPGATVAASPPAATVAPSDAAAADLNPTPGSGVGSAKPEDPEEAFELFLKERYGRLVATVRLIVGDHATAEDIAQETFARAFLSWGKLWPDGNPGGWAHRVATNLALSWRRRKMREWRAVKRLESRTQTTTELPDVRPDVRAAVASLPLRQRTAVALHYVLGLPVADAAEAMDCRPGTVKSLLHEARRRLRQDLGEEA